MDWNKLHLVGRRRFMKNAAAMGVSAASLAYGTPDGLVKAGSSNEVPYVRYLKGTADGEGRKPIYDTIPRHEWANRWTAVGLKEKVAAKIRRKWGDGLISPAFGALKESPTGFGVKVYYTEYHQVDGTTKTPKPSIEEVRSELSRKGTGRAATGEHQEEREGIPIKVVSRVEREAACGDPENGDVDVMNKDPYDGVPASPRTYIGSKTEVGSICAPFNKDGYGQGWISSGHVAGERGEGESAYQGGNSDNLGWEKYGVVRQSRVDADIDFCFIEDTVGVKYPAEKVADTSGDLGYAEDIVGIVTDDTLINDADNSLTYYTQGYKTSRTSGSLIDTGGIFGTSYVTGEQDVVQGDSGGILMDISGGDAYVAGVIKSQVNDDNDGDSCGDDVKCTTAETVENKAGGEFTT